MKHISKLVTAVSLAMATSAVAGCNSSISSQSEIIKQFKAAGGGDPEKADVQGIKLFLSQRLPLNKQLTPLCNERVKTADANWTITGEGKICTVSAQIVMTSGFFALPASTNSDHRSFSPIPPGLAK